MSDLQAVQPVCQLQQVAGHGPEPTNLLLGGTGSVPQKNTGGDPLLVHVQSTTASIPDAPASLLPRVKSRASTLSRLSLACSPLIAAATIRYACGRSGYTGARASTAPAPFNLSALDDAPSREAQSVLIFILHCEHSAHHPLVPFANPGRARVGAEALLRQPILPPRSVEFVHEGSRGPRHQIALSSSGERVRCQC